MATTMANSDTDVKAATELLLQLINTMPASPASAVDTKPAERKLWHQKHQPVIANIRNHGIKKNYQHCKNHT